MGNWGYNPYKWRVITLTQLITGYRPTLWGTSRNRKHTKNTSCIKKCLFCGNFSAFVSVTSYITRLYCGVPNIYWKAFEIAGGLLLHSKWTMFFARNSFWSTWANNCSTKKNGGSHRQCTKLLALVNGPAVFWEGCPNTQGGRDWKGCAYGYMTLIELGIRHVFWQKSWVTTCSGIAPLKKWPPHAQFSWTLKNK